MRQNLNDVGGSLKGKVQSVLKKMGVFQRLKASCVHDIYWSLVRPELAADRAKEIEFYRAMLVGFQRGNVIFDIGANDGAKTDVFLRLGAQVVAVEPDETNQQVLRGKFLNRRLVRKPVCIEGKAVSDRVATKTMWVQAPGSALNTLNRKWVNTLQDGPTHFDHRLNFIGEKDVETTTLETLIKSYGVPFFIKIDVEGHEVSVLHGLKQPVPYLSFEVNLPEFRSEGLDCIDILNGIAASGEFNYSAGCRVGMGSKDWLSRDGFIRIFEKSQDCALEVFWRTPARFIVL